MLKDHELTQLIQNCGLSEKAQAEIKRIRSLELFRRMRSARGNVSGRYPTCNMTRLIRLESHKIELAGIYEIQHDDDVLEHCDHPP
jgi:putative transposase